MQTVYTPLAFTEPPRFLRSLWAVAFLTLLAATIYNFIALADVPSLPSYLALNTFTPNSTFSEPLPKFIKEVRFHSRSAHAVFLIPSCIAELFKCIFPHFYWRLVIRKIQVIRMVEFSITASTMMWLIAYDCGITDRFALCTIASNIAAMMFVGYWPSANPHPSWRQHAVGFYFLISAFSPAWQAYASHDASPPAFVTAIVVLMFILFSSYGFLSIACAYFNEPQPYLITEAGSVILSITAKSLMVFIRIWGELARQ